MQCRQMALHFFMIEIDMKKCLCELSSFRITFSLFEKHMIAAAQKYTLKQNRVDR